jgi:hypothetical protein
MKTMAHIDQETLKKVEDELRLLYPKFKSVVVHDLSRYVLGNINYLSQPKVENGSVKEEHKFQHRENIIGFGTGFDWVHSIDDQQIFIVNPLALDNTNNIIIAANVILDNIKEKRINPEEGLCFVVSAPYRGDTADDVVWFYHAHEKADQLITLGYKTLKEHVPEIFKYDLQFIAATQNEDDRRLAVIPVDVLESFSKTGYQQKPNNKITQWLLDHNEAQSKEFSSKQARDARADHRAEYPTEIAICKCMDGRLNFSVSTNTPIGIVKPYRIGGAKFSIGWSAFMSDVAIWSNYAKKRGRERLIICMYHFSSTDKHYGCKAHDYDTDAARDCVLHLQTQFQRVFSSLGANPSHHTLVVGIDTDDGSLVLHGQKGEQIFVKDLISLTEKSTPSLNGVQSSVMSAN